MSKFYSGIDHLDMGVCPSCFPMFHGGVLFFWQLCLHVRLGTESNLACLSIFVAEFRCS